MTTRADRRRGTPRRASAPETRQASRVLWLTAGVVLAVLAAAAVAAILLGSPPPSTGVDEPASTPITVSGSALPELADPENDSAVGQPIPTIAGTDLTGAPIEIAPGDGPMAIVVLAHWCPHCQAEVPVLVDYLGTTGMPDGVRLVGVSTSIDAARPNYPPSTWLTEEGWTVPTLVDDAESHALAATGLTSFPGFIFVDADGRVVQRVTGELPIEEFDAMVRSLAP